MEKDASGTIEDSVQRKTKNLLMSHKNKFSLDLKPQKSKEVENLKADEDDSRVQLKSEEFEPSIPEEISHATHQTAGADSKSNRSNVILETNATVLSQRHYRAQEATLNFYSAQQTNILEDQIKSKEGKEKQGGLID